VSTLFPAIERWLQREDDEGAVARARRYFAGVWLVYDVIDVLIGGTQHAAGWLPHPTSPVILGAQLVLIACGVQLVRNRMPFAFGVLAAVARLVEAGEFGLNDFYWYATLMLLMAHGDGGPLEQGKRPLWVRHALLAELGWIYLATGVLKLNPDWLDGGHLFVRTEYLARAFHWPFPSFVRAAFTSLRLDSALACMAALAEISLGVVLFLRRPYWLGVALVVGIHTFATLVTNVWFFSASAIGCVVLLLPRRHRLS
jgi:hypothetical protein